MREELEEKLYNDFPLLYEERNLRCTQTCMCWGFTCGDGWYDIIHNLSSDIYPEIIKSEENGIKFRACQVKEKFGTLRFYMTGTTEKISKAIDKAEKLSAETCELCGKPGTLRTDKYWIRTLCDSCANSR